MNTLKKIPLADTVGLAILFFLGLAAVIGGLGYGAFGDDGRVGPGFMPVVAGAIMMIAALLTFVKNFIVTARGGLIEEEEIDPDELLAQAGDEPSPEVIDAVDNEDSELDIFGRTASQRSWAVVFIFAIIGLCIFLVDYIGLLLALTLMVLLLLLVVEKRGVVASVISAVIAFAFGYIVFATLLDVRLPQGMLGLV